MLILYRPPVIDAYVAGTEQGSHAKTQRRKELNSVPLRALRVSAVLLSFLPPADCQIESLEK